MTTRKVSQDAFKTPPGAAHIYGFGIVKGLSGWTVMMLHASVFHPAGGILSARPDSVILTGAGHAATSRLSRFYDMEALVSDRRSDILSCDQGIKVHIRHLLSLCILYVLSMPGQFKLLITNTITPCEHRDGIGMVQRRQGEDYAVNLYGVWLPVVILQFEPG